MCQHSGLRTGRSADVRVTIWTLDVTRFMGLGQNVSSYNKVYKEDTQLKFDSDFTFWLTHETSSRLKSMQYPWLTRGAKYWFRGDDRGRRSHCWLHKSRWGRLMHSHLFRKIRRRCVKFLIHCWIHRLLRHSGKYYTVYLFRYPFRNMYRYLHLNVIIITLISP